MSAKKYGFDDLIIVPYIQLNEEQSIKVTENMLGVWGVTAEEVITQAMQNVKGKVTTFEEAFSMPLPMPAPFKIITTETMTFGAIAAITMQETLKEMYPDGYIIIPSSVHEVLIMPSDDTEMAEFAKMITEVNKTCLQETEILGDKAYEFVA